MFKSHTIVSQIVYLKYAKVKSMPIKENAPKYERDASRSLQCPFLEQATEEDETIIRNSLEGLADDRIEYNDVSN